MMTEIDDLIVMANRISINGKSVHEYSRRIFTENKTKISKIFKKLTDINTNLSSTKKLYKNGFNPYMCRYVRFNVFNQMLQIKREIKFNINRNINEINTYKIVYGIRKKMVSKDEELTKIDKRKKWKNKQRKIIKQKMKERKQKKLENMEACSPPINKNIRLGTLHHFINRAKFTHTTDVKCIKELLNYYSSNGLKHLYEPAVRIQKIFRAFIARKYVNEHMNIIIKRHLEVTKLEDIYVNLDFKIKLSLANIVSGVNKKDKFNEWIIKIFTKLYPNYQYKILNNNLFNIEILDNTKSKGFIYTRNCKGTITVSNTEFKKINLSINQNNIKHDNIYIISTSRITDISLNKFKDIGLPCNNIYTFNNIIELLKS
jgi:hypothetical protein